MNSAMGDVNHGPLSILHVRFESIEGRMDRNRHLRSHRAEGVSKDGENEVEKENERRRRRDTRDRE